MAKLQPFLPAKRAFVVQLSTDANPALGDIRGRVEHLVSGEADHFVSSEELQAFMSRILSTQEDTVEPD